LVLIHVDHLRISRTDERTLKRRGLQREKTGAKTRCSAHLLPVGGYLRQVEGLAQVNQIQHVLLEAASTKT